MTILVNISFLKKMDRRVEIVPIGYHIIKRKSF